MTSLTYTYAALLVILGLAGYFATGRQSVTALIPAFFAAVVIIAYFAVSRMTGAGALKWTLIVLAVIGLAATVTGIPKLITLIGGGEVARPAATISQSIMAVVSLIYAILLLRK